MSGEIQFEKALERLEKIVQDLETGSISLEDALKKYEEGVKLSRACQEKLTQAEKRIEVLTRDLNGALKRENFTPDADGSEPAKGPAKRRKNETEARKNTENESGDSELLF
ncbi:MAG: exodeoxyribonuclease VII small subunit [Candidatus Omnitrophica bacterium]|nr:exodeoxyribonuclease VII small subunit [Candidatus Omnitrophota bacterium]MDD5672012.1 exodeoxyribonuclease VII small subunit [Candidatus Omnitrophota bacterium]